MNLKPQDLDAAVKANILSDSQAQNLWNFLHGHSQADYAQPRFSLGHVIYYLGGLIVMGSMSWFMVRAWEQLGGLGIAALSAFIATCFFIVGKSLSKNPEHRIPGGILVTVAVSITPLIVYGLQKSLGWWPGALDATGSYTDYHVYVRSNWIVMELATVVVGCITLKYVRYPFITFPIAFALWYLSMDLTPLIMGETYGTWDARKWVSLYFGACLLLATYFIDRRTKEDYAFWGYLFGALAFWGGLSSMSSDSELNKLIYCLINLSLIFLSVFLSRRIFIILGSMGVLFYLSHLAYKVFRDSLVFPLVLALLGILIIYLGIQYQKHKESIDGWMLSKLPPALKELRPTERH